MTKTESSLKTNAAVTVAALEGARRATGDAATVTLPAAVVAVPSTEVPAMARRRQFSTSEKRRIVTEADGCTQPGEVGALLRREGIYSSHLSTWRRQRKTAELRAFQPNKRGPKVNPGLADSHRLADLTRENARLRTRLSQAHLIIEVQKKISILLGIPTADEDA